MHGWRDDVVPVENSIRFAREYGATLHVLDTDHRMQDRIREIGYYFEYFLVTLDKFGELSAVAGGVRMLRARLLVAVARRCCSPAAAAQPPPPPGRAAPTVFDELVEQEAQRVPADGRGRDSASTWRPADAGAADAERRRRRAAR